MKKVFGKLSLIIASVVCMIIFFGCSSISSRAVLTSPKHQEGDSYEKSL